MATPKNQNQSQEDTLSIPMFKGMKSRWTTYRGELLIYTLVGGIPKDPDTIRGWIKSRLEIDDAEVVALAEETIQALGKPRDELTSAELDEVTDDIMAEHMKGNTFKVFKEELCWEGRCLKAAINEAANATYPGITKWPGHPGNIKKGLENFLKERVEVVDTYIPLGRSKPDIEGEQRIKRVSGPQGKRSTINIVDVCNDVKISFTIKVLDDCIKPELWFELWEYIMLGGVGADRGRGDGRCRLVSFEKIS